MERTGSESNKPSVRKSIIFVADKFFQLVIFPTKLRNNPEEIRTNHNIEFSKDSITTTFIGQNRSFYPINDPFPFRCLNHMISGSCIDSSRQVLDVNN